MMTDLGDAGEFELDDRPLFKGPLTVDTSRASGEEDEDDRNDNDNDDNDVRDAHSDELTRNQAYCLYLSHFLSMWNSRMYEFGAILFIQAAFPGNFIASSINGIAETVCVLFFSSALGRWVDYAPSRLRTLLLTIIVNRVTVVVCCLTWFFILSLETVAYKHILFAVVLMLGMAEKLSRMTNILSMERDWVPTLAPPSLEKGARTAFGLTHLNAVMKRIDLLCKLVAPLAISTFISTVAPVKVAVAVVAVVSMLSWGLECWCVQKVFNQNRLLRVPKEAVDGSNLAAYTQLRPHKYYRELSTAKPFHIPFLFLLTLLSNIKLSIYSYVDGLRYYFSTSVWIPSICIAVLHASVLSYSGTLMVYLLNAGFSLGLINVAIAVGSLFEIGSTYVFPWAVGRFSGKGIDIALEGEGREAQEILLQSSNDGEYDAGDKESEQKQTSQMLEAGVVKVGLWGICGLFLSLVPVMLALFLLDSTVQYSGEPSATSSPLITHPFATLTLLTFLSISLLGRWTYDLSTTQLTQTRIPAARRSTFGGTEMSIVSFISLGHWIAAAVWHAQQDFKWLGLASFVGVGLAAFAYGRWTRR